VDRVSSRTRQPARSHTRASRTVRHSCTRWPGTASGNARRLRWARIRRPFHRWRSACCNRRIRCGTGRPRAAGRLGNTYRACQRMFSRRPPADRRVEGTSCHKASNTFLPDSSPRKRHPESPHSLQRSCNCLQSSAAHRCRSGERRPFARRLAMQRRCWRPRRRSRRRRSFRHRKLDRARERTPNSARREALLTD
jgi:hypothetical protein